MQMALLCCRGMLTKCHKMTGTYRDQQLTAFVQGVYRREWEEPWIDELTGFCHHARRPEFMPWDHMERTNSYMLIAASPSTVYVHGCTHTHMYTHK